MAEEENTTEAEEGGSKKKLFIIIGAVVFLLIAGGVTAFFLLSGDESAENEEQQEVAAEAVEEDKVPTYYAVPKPKEPGLVISLLPGTRFKQAQINMTLFTNSPMLADYLVKNDPMIRHHIINYLSTEKPELFIDRKGREKMQEGLKNKLSEVIASSANEQDRLLADKLENVYFSKFILQ